MEQEGNKNRNRRRRTNEQLDRDVLSELEKLVAIHGFGNVTLNALTKASGIEANVFYRRYGTMDELYDRLVRQYELRINNTINIASLHLLGPKKFFSETLKILFRDLAENKVMQKLLLYELEVVNDTTKRTGAMRDVMNMNLIAFYEHLFEPAKINIKSVTATLVGGIFYLILHKECAKLCTIDFGTPEGEKAFSEGIDFLTDAIFDKLEAYKRNKEAVRCMLSDGISESKICKYLSITRNDLKILAQNPEKK